jgi:hypothetical protein
LVRTTSQRFFASEFIEGYELASLVRGSTAANGSHFGGGRRLFRQISHEEIPIERLGRQGRRAQLFLPRSARYTPADRRGKLDGVRWFRHSEVSLSPRQTASKPDLRAVFAPAKL